MTLNIIFTLIGVIFGWFIAVWGYIEGKEIKGGLKKNFKKYVKPRNKIQLVVYLLTGLIYGLIFAIEYSSILGWLVIIVSGILIHASIVDSISFQINSAPVIFPIIILIIINLVLWVFNVNLATTYTSSDKLLAGAVAATIFFLIINLTKKKGMGEGDLFVFTLMGLVLGIWKLIIAFYLMIIIGAIVGLIIGLKKKKIRGVRIPFVPFMTVGFIIAALIGQNIIDFYIQTFWLY